MTAARRTSGAALLQSDAWLKATDAVTAGVAVGVLCLPVVTAPAAFVAGVRHLDAVHSGRPARLAHLVRETFATVRETLPLGLAALTMLVGLTISTAIAARFDVPGRTLWLVVLAVVVATSFVAGLLGVGSVATEHRRVSVAGVMQAAGHRVRCDRTGVLLVGAGVAICAALVGMSPALLVVVPGLLLHGVVVTTRRHRHRSLETQPRPGAAVDMRSVNL